MAYRIRVHGVEGYQYVIASIVGALMHDVYVAITNAGFKVGDFDYVGSTNGRGPKAGSGKPGYIVDLRKIRLLKAKPYCGNHPGECVAAGVRTKAGLKRASNCLEWEDWIRFNGIVNDILDAKGVDADITTTGADIDEGSFLFIRRGTKRRQRYDWVEVSRNQFNAIRHVNYGTADQFREQTIVEAAGGMQRLAAIVAGRA